MPRTSRLIPAILLFTAAAFVAACQSPTDPGESGPTVDEFVDVGVAPDPIVAGAATDGKSYGVVVDDVTITRLYDWYALYTVTLRLNDNANDEDLDIEWPVVLTSASFVPGQATGGIRNAPPAGEVEYSASEIAAASSNSFPSANSGVTLVIDLWYDFPNLRKEALVNASFSFRDGDNRTFTRTAEFRIAP